MSLLGFFWSLILLAAAGVSAWLVWRMAREQAQIKRSLDIKMLQVLLPRNMTKEEKGQVDVEWMRARLAVAEKWLTVLASLPIKATERMLYGRPSLVFEIVARGDGMITFYVGCERRYSDFLEKQIYAHYPEAEVRPAPEYTVFVDGDTVRGGQLKLVKDAHLPIATFKELEADPMQTLTGALAKMKAQDAAVIQLVAQPAGDKVRRRGKEAARRTVQGKQSDVETKKGLGTIKESFKKKDEKQEAREDRRSKLSPRAQEKVELVDAKQSRQQFDVNIRLLVAAREKEDAERVLEGLGAAFSQYKLPDLNSLTMKQAVKTNPLVKDTVFRIPRDRLANTLSVAEIASLFHFPLPTTETPNIIWRGAKVEPAPPDLPQEGIMLGLNRFRGGEVPVYLAEDDRRRHVYLIGQTGTGKTTMFLNMIRQDMWAGHGVGVVDPHGDLIEDILLHVPPDRVEDVILFDPRDMERPLGFNILEARNEGQKDLIVNETVQILQKLAARLNPESIGPMFEHYLRNSLLALAEDPDATLLDVPRMFVDEKFRNMVLRRVVNPTVKQFWEQEFAQSQKGQMSADMLSYVISKLGRFVSNRTMRNLIGQSRSSFDVREVMDQKKILLCNLSKGSLGDINSDLLGFVLVSKLQVAALGRADVAEEARPDFYLYLDEFQNFTTDSIAVILSEARKYRLDLNLTHQFIQQLDDKTKEAVFGNVGTVVSYRVGVEDAEVLAKQFEPVFSEYDLTNLERFTMCARVLVEGTPRRPFSLVGASPPQTGSSEVRELVRARSREKYGRNVKDVEESVLERFRYGQEGKKSGAGGKSDDDYLSESLFDIS